MPNPKVTAKITYSKQSHTQKPQHHYSPAYSTGNINRKEKALDITIHLTPELRNRPKIRKAIIRHEMREAKLIASGKPISQAHKQASRQDPKYWNREIDNLPNYRGKFQKG